MAARTAATVRHLTIEQLADRLQIDPDTLRKWRRDGRGPACIRDGEGFIRYRERDVEDWENAHLVEPATA